MLDEVIAKHPRLFAECRWLSCGSGWRQIIEEAFIKLDALAAPTGGQRSSMGYSTIDTCKACANQQENSYSGGFVSHVVHCSSCGEEVWLGYGETPAPCTRCSGEVLPGGEPRCQKCGGREWHKPQGRGNFHSTWD